MKTLIPGEPDPGPDDQDSLAEDAAISRGDLIRSESRRRHLHRAALVLFWFSVCAALIIATVWLYHLVTPENWHFLSDDQESQLKTILISGITSAAVTEYARKMFKDEK